MFSTDMYINNLKKKMNKKEKNELFYFGLVFGLILLFISLFRLITDSNVNNDKYYFILFILSLIDLFFLLFIPSKLKYFKLPVFFIGKLIFRVLLSVLLLVIYIVWFIPASLVNFFRKRNSNSTFKQKNNNMIKINNNNVFSQIKNIFSYFIFEGSWYLIPLVIILVIIGLILFFAQSSAITPLIYPFI